MKLLIIIDNNDFFLPDYLEKFLNYTKNTVVEVGIVKKIPKASSMNLFILRNIHNLYLFEFCKLLILKIKNKLFNDSIKKVLTTKNIPFFHIHNRINQKNFIKKVKNNKIDFIISINSLIFSKKILNSPKYCCINRHTSLLPKYKGLLPVFQSLKNNEKKFGVSFHVMTDKLDVGKILVQKKIQIKKNDSLMDLYQKSFIDYENLIDKSIDNFLKNSFVKNKYEDTYNSWPNKIDWKKFRKNKKRFI